MFELPLGKRRKKPVLVPRASKPLMRALEPRIVLDAAGGDDFISVAIGAVHGTLADDYISNQEANNEQEAPSSEQGLSFAEELPAAVIDPLSKSSSDRREIAFVVDGLPDTEGLISLLPHTAEVIVLNASGDGIVQMATALNGRADIDAIHIFSHGSAGELHLGETTLTADNMVGEYEEVLAGIGSALSVEADILIYGCDFASGEVGQGAVETLSRLTSADVAASNDITGHVDLGGDWNLETEHGEIETAVISGGAAWRGSLDEPRITSNGGGFFTFVDVDENQTFVTTVTASDDDLPDDVLTYSIVGGADAAQFTIDPNTGDLNFITAPDFENQTDQFPTNGIYTVSVRVTDDDGDTDTQTLSVVVRDVDESLQANDDGFSVNEDGSVSIDVLANDVDPEGDPLSVMQVNGLAVVEGGAAVNVSNGTVELVAGELIFKPVENYNGPASFTYSASDGNGNTSTANVTGTVNPANDQPVAKDNEFTVSEDGTVNGNVIIADTGSGADSDIDGDALILAPGSVGTFTTVQGGSISLLQNGDFSFSPAPNFNGSDSFSYTITDGALTDTAVVAFNVLPQNDAPSADSDSFTVPEDGSVSIDVLANDLDVDGDTLIITRVAGNPIIEGGAAIAVPNGSVRLLGGELVFTPTLNYVGPISFDYTVDDGNGSSSTVAVSGTVGGVNDAPDADDDTFTVQEEGIVSVVVLANDTDLDGDTVTVAQVNGQPIADGGPAVAVANGSVELIGGALQFSPAPNFSGNVSFNYTVADGNGGFDTAQVHGTVTPINDAPQGTDKTITLTEDSVVSFEPSDFGFNDPDDNPANAFVSVLIDTLPGFGALTLNGVNVTAGQTIPVAVLNTLQFTPVANGNNSTTPGSTFSSFTFRVIDDGGGADTALVANTITISLLPSNDAPVATDNTYASNEDTIFNGNALTNNTGLGTDDDVDGDALVLDASSVGTFSTLRNGVITLSPNGDFSYTPGANFSGVDSFVYSISDGTLTDNAKLTFNVAPINDAPVSTGSAVATPEGVPYTFELTDFAFADQENDGASSVTISGLSLAGGDLVHSGGVVVTNGTTLSAAQIATLTFTPLPNSNATALFNYTVNDADFGTTAAVMTITVQTANDAPFATDNSYSLAEDSAVIGNLITEDTGAGPDSDLDGDALSISSELVGSFVTDKNGSIVLGQNGQFTYTPAANFNGSDSFVYSITDGPATSSATVYFDVTAQNDAPVAVTNTFNITAGESIIVDVLGNDSDPDGDTLIITAIDGQPVIDGGPAISVRNGLVSLSAGRLVVFANTSSDGPVSFDYSISDGNGTTATAFVNGTVSGVNTAPEATDDNYSFDRDAPGTGNLIDGESENNGRDFDFDGDTLRIDERSLGTRLTEQGGTITIEANGDFTYLPPPGFTGTDSFAYVITDGLASDGGTVVFEVTDNSPVLANPPAFETTIIETTSEPEKKDDEIEIEKPAETEEEEEEEQPTRPSPPQTSVLQLPAAPQLNLQPPAPDTTTAPVPVAQVEPGPPPASDNSPSATEIDPEPVPRAATSAGEPGRDLPEFKFTPIDQKVLIRELDRTKEDIQEFEGILSTTTAKVTFTFGAILGVGSVSWLLQSGILAATFLSTLPAWKRFDPIAVVSQGHDDVDDEELSYLQMMEEQIQHVGSLAPKG